MLIRHADPERDAAACLAIYAPFVTGSPVSFESVAPSVSEFAERIAHYSRTHPFIAAEDDGTVAGFAYACPHRERAAYRWTAETSVYVDADYRGRGVGAALYEQLLSLLRSQGIRLALGGVTLPNDASIALHRRCGFVQIGVYPSVGWKAGAWRDVAWLACDLNPKADHEPGPPPEPGPPTQLDQLLPRVTAEG
jgi:phosphinothricin acetyltransferase